MRIWKCQESRPKPQFSKTVANRQPGPVLGNRAGEPACRLSATSL